MNRIAGLFIALTLLSAVFWAIESLFAANPRQPRFYRRRGFRTDLAYWFLTPLVTKSISQIGLAFRKRSKELPGEPPSWKKIEQADAFLFLSIAERQNVASSENFVCGC